MPAAVIFCLFLALLLHVCVCVLNFVAHGCLVLLSFMQILFDSHNRVCGIMDFDEVYGFLDLLMK